ncbi:PREDICTED: transmembrane protein 104-like isoform X1 [Amphimedon queenslandica]|uniref:Amino acid transporter transmembrane domain-containing protein n=1 Tax=Amphimedon queenslandica TaxID=400682 RepID=A0A1X7VTH4_AMPQE|nr:PREDICTED: transmembrane protein 104-like isoform X1 [Amphimedon queenslandica]|eukprot:XP_003382868.1 PREDICTED: transmembrane protein 104-like isoform X1 [Amphimedon queenslandica]
MATYSRKVGFVYIFNLLIGAGALALPKTFSDTGIALGTVFITLLCTLSYITACYVIEAMAAANAYERIMERKCSMEAMARHDSESKQNGITMDPSEAEKQEVTIYIDQKDYEITKKFEYGSMANLFFHISGIILAYLVFCIMSYGDVSYFNIAIATSLSHVTCQLQRHHQLRLSLISNDTLFGDNETWFADQESRNDCFTNFGSIKVYYICLAIIAFTLGPFVFFDITSSKFIQILTTVARYIGFGLMTILVILRFIEGHRYMPQVANVKSLPFLYGIALYSAKIQDFIPGIIMPMSSKEHIYRILLGDFVTCWLFYLFLSYASVFAFPGDEIEPLYTLNFFQPATSGSIDWRLVLGTMLALLPVISLVSIYPVLTVTLRENLKSLSKIILECRLKRKVKFPVIVDRFLFPPLVFIPPLIVAYITQDIELLASITGSFPGITIQCVMPAAFVIAARYKIKKALGTYDNPYKAPLSNMVFVVVVLGWSVISVVMMSINLILNPPE